MTNLPVSRVVIPPADPIANQVADIIINKLRSLGADPRAMALHPFGVQLCQSWTRGDLSDSEFGRCVKNLLILNQKLKARP